MYRGSSPMTYGRYSVNSTEKPWYGLRCSPCQNPSTTARARSSRCRIRMRVCGSMKLVLIERSDSSSFSSSSSSSMDGGVDEDEDEEKEEEKGARAFSVVMLLHSLHQPLHRPIDIQPLGLRL